MRAGRAYVRRRGPGRLVIMAAALALGTGLFVAYARPAALNASGPAEPRVTNDVTLAGASVYLVELCRVADEASSRVEAARYAPRGAAGYVMERDGEFIVIGSGYEREHEANDVAMNLTAGESIDAVALVEAQDEVKLRITATESQLKAFTGADDILRRASGELRELAVALDSDKAEPVEVRAEAAALQGRIDSAYEALYAAAGENPNAVAGKWLQMLSDAREACEGIAKDEFKTRLYLSGAVKRAFLGIRLSHIEALKDLV